MAKIEKDDRLFNLLFKKNFHENGNQPLFSSKGFFEKLAIVAHVGPDAADKKKSDLPEAMRSDVNVFASKLSTVFPGIHSWESAFGAEADKHKKEVGAALRYMLVTHPGLPKQENNRLVNDIIDEYENIVGIRVAPPQAAQQRARGWNKDFYIPPTAATRATTPTPEDVEFDNYVNPRAPAKGAIEKFLLEPQAALGDKPLFVNVSAIGRALMTRTGRFKGNNALIKAHDAVVLGLKDVGEFGPRGGLFRLVVDAATNRIETMHAQKQASIREDAQKTFLASFQTAIVTQFPELALALQPAKPAGDAPSVRRSFETVKRVLANGSSPSESLTAKNLISHYFHSQTELANTIARIEGLDAKGMGVRVSTVLSHTPWLLAPGHTLYGQIEKAAHQVIPEKAEEFLEKLRAIALPLKAKHEAEHRAAHAHGNGAVPHTNGAAKTAAAYDAAAELLEKDRQIAALREQLAATEEKLASSERQNNRKGMHILRMADRLNNIETLLKQVRAASAEALDHTTHAQGNAERALTKGNGKAQPNTEPSHPTAQGQAGTATGASAVI